MISFKSSFSFSKERVGVVDQADMLVNSRPLPMFWWRQRQALNALNGDDDAVSLEVFTLTPSTSSKVHDDT
ncbi:hypothetical protein F441_00194 [Phytophthora nicotianae CJ01A1]|uniref:Uncharacterized protein n=2 Tax=Phytophthora nicotianae TaxID=4792 RepID=W3A6N4_PHYNI|nr:hypothetical protein F441_00197 [Phytophthora nicotianae CJ01A1]ETP27290.1 hypothetical protein F441_00194 [Phytophthora nicotianae CJ01A1]ETP55248.1 hypothetical protein F442_00187 [Phytophthora nicotianae P10297]